MIKVLEHEHPLKLIDLQLEFPDYEEEDEDEDDDGDGDGEVVKKEGFSEVECDRCGEVISMYHRYYYNCSFCHHFSLHKFCAELSTSLHIACDPHPLTQQWGGSRDFNWQCRICGSEHKTGELCYGCSECDFWIDVTCALEAGKNRIHHPCHQHPLICAISRPTLCLCIACGKEHKGIFFLCTTCTNFTIQSQCAFLPKTLLIQHTTDNTFHHTHPLTISYSFPKRDQEAKHYPRCRVCGEQFYQKLWIYKCDKCMYYAHLDCATSRTEPFMSIFLRAGVGKTYKNYKDVDHPDLLHLPFPDETYNIPKHLFFQESGTSGDDKVNLEHMSHQHPLILVDQTQRNVQTLSWLLKCHNPMKKTQLLCNGCLRPIMSTMPFYRCAEICDFSLHEWCTRLPPKIENHPAHPKHTLDLMYSDIPDCFFGVFQCDVCHLYCNGFAYCCVECGFCVDVTCGFIPKEITHKSHPNHLLSLVPKQDRGTCLMCLDYLGDHELSFHCNTCDIDIHPECALLLHEKIRHKYDKHTMHLSYLPIENHKSQYFCEICEEDLNPHEAFYHCKDCVQSIHTACAPLILQCETETFTYSGCKNVYQYVNMKFGGIHNDHSHPHPLSFAQGVASDGRCSRCIYDLYTTIIFKCLRCKFTIHYTCCEHLNNI